MNFQERVEKLIDLLHDAERALKILSESPLPEEIKYATLLGMLATAVNILNESMFKPVAPKQDITNSKLN